MRRGAPLSVRLAVGALLGLAACGEEAASAARETSPAPAVAVTEPWQRIPPDSLYGATAPENVRLLPVTVDALGIPDGWNGMRIAVLSDFRLGLWPGNEAVVEAAVRRAAESGADLVALLGDYVEGAADTATLARVLQPLRGRQALAVLGRHDARTDSLAAAVSRTLARAGVRVLSDDAVPITRNGATAFVAGASPEMVERGFGEREYLLAILGGGARTPVLLTHSPLVAAAAPDDRYVAILAGNTFCGEVEVAGTPRLSWLRSTALPGAAVEGADRFFRLDGNTLFVTCGLGYSFLPVRLSAPPEVAIVTLASVTAGAAAAETPAPDSTAVPDSLMERFRVGADSTAAAADTTG